MSHLRPAPAPTGRLRLLVFAGAGLLLASLLAVVSPLAVQPAAGAGSSDWKQLSAGSAHTCGIRTTGRLYCWGDNFDGQLGVGSHDGSDVPVEVAGGWRWTKVAAGDYHTCARRSDGRLFCWGYNVAGQVGDGSTAERTTPRQVAGRWTNWTTVGAGSSHTCARRKNGRLYCWGFNGGGRLGDGTTTQRTTPRQVARGWTNWTSVSAGANHTCGRRGNGRLYCWGSNFYGQLGIGASGGGRVKPAEVARRWTSWTSVSAGFDHTCGRRGNGRMYCWGSNSDAQLGIGFAAGDQASPAETGADLRSWTKVEAGMYHSCARRGNGRLYCWGANQDGRLGVGGTEPRQIPSQVVGGWTDWATLALGARHTCATRASKRAYCWGLNNYGQVGDGTGVQRNEPTEVHAP